MNTNDSAITSEDIPEDVNGLRELTQNLINALEAIEGDLGDVSGRLEILECERNPY